MSSNNELNFRKANAEDLPAIVAIYNEIIPGKLVTAELETVTVADKEAWFNSYNEEYPLWVMEDSGRIIGWVSIEPYHPRPAYHHTVEVSIYFDENFRGRGLGSQALQFAEEQAVKLGHKTLVALIFHQNVPSIKLFKKNGFDTWAHLPRVAEMGSAEEERDLDILGKRIRD